MFIEETLDKGETWKDRLEMLCIRYSHLGVCGDLAALSEPDAWGLYLRLNRLIND